MNGLGVLATMPTDDLLLGFRVFVVGFIGVVVCMSLLALALKVAVDLALRVGTGGKPAGGDKGTTAPAAKPAAVVAAPAAKPAAPAAGNVAPNSTDKTA